MAAAIAALPEIAGVAGAEGGLTSALGMEIPESLKTAGKSIGETTGGIVKQFTGGMASALGNLMNEGYNWRVRQGDTQLKKEEAAFKEELEEKLMRAKDPLQRRLLQEEYDRKLGLIQKDYENTMNKLQVEYDRSNDVFNRKMQNFELTKQDFHDVLGMLKKNLDYAGDRQSKQQAAATLASFMGTLGAVFPKGSGVIESPVYSRKHKVQKGCGIANHEYVQPPNFYYEIAPEVRDNIITLGAKYRKTQPVDTIPENEVREFRKYFNI